MLVCLLSVVLLCPRSEATTNGQGRPVMLDEIVVTAARAPTLEGGVPGALSVIDWESLRSTELSLAIDEPLRRVPGMFVQNSFNFAQDQRISIRGFGMRAAFGVREVKVLVDGIPESSPDGQTQLDNLDLGSARRIEVLRGPAAALYGNASGGVINILTDEGGGSPFAESRFVGGSLGLRKFEVRAGGSLGNWDYRVSGIWTLLDGYRQLGDMENRQVIAKLKRAVTANSDLTILINHADSPWAGDPGGLTPAEVEANRRQARALNATLDGGEKVRQGRLGLVYRHQLASGHEVVLTQYSLYREFFNKLPILPAAGDGIVSFDRLGVGGGIRYVGDIEWGRRSNQLVAGVDTDYQTDDRERRANVGGSSGALGFAQQESVRGVGVYLRDELRLHERLALTAGLRYDNLRFAAVDRFLADGDDSGARTLNLFSQSGGIVFDARTNVQVYANVGTAFQTPTTTELANPTGGGGFNPALEPQTAINHELGIRAQPNARLRLELALFLICIRDELIPFTSPSGRDYFRNAGRSERKGIELGVEYNLAPGWDWRASYTALNARYRDYVTAGADYSGNREPGIPAHQLFTELRWRGESGFFGSVDLQFVDRYHVNDANTADNAAYTPMNLRFGYAARIGRGTLTPFVAVNNILNQRYNGQTRLNAFGGRFYEPSPRLTAFAGLTWRVAF
jgi:iron complex outermembrane receptor protein